MKDHARCSLVRLSKKPFLGFFFFLLGVTSSSLSSGGGSPKLIRFPFVLG
jgi:hypothetical protein